jgi:hypothetical protein
MENAGLQDSISARTNPILPLLFAAAVTFCIAITSSASTNDVARTDHTILKEPAYQSTPQYSLLTFGTNNDVKVWMSICGENFSPYAHKS